MFDGETLVGPRVKDAWLWQPLVREPVDPVPPGAVLWLRRVTGFAFTFSSGVDITGVSVDPASAADFRPAGVSPLELLTPTDIIVNLVGENPAVGDKLILDVTTAVTPPPSVPEPASLVLLKHRSTIESECLRKTARQPRVSVQSDKRARSSSTLH